MKTLPGAAALALGLMFHQAFGGEAWKDIVPTPRQTRVVGEDWRVPASTVIVTDDFDKARIGAEEINHRFADLKAGPLNVVKKAPPNAGLVLRITCPPRFPEQIAAWPGDKPDVTGDSPGEQGYVIQFAERDGQKEVLLAGSDEMGALYACVTFRHLLERDEQGVRLSRVAVRDWPDFKWRGAPSVSFVASGVGGKREEGVKRFVDWCLRRKINVLRDYVLVKPGRLPKGPIPWVAEVNKYARARGFLAFQFGMTYVGYGKPDPKNPLHKNLAMVNPRKLFTWADDAALKVTAESLARYCADNGFNLLGLHPPDGGGVMDPSQFSKRSAYDRKRWSDDQRAEADAHVFNMFFDAAKKLQPNIRVGFTLYPYSPIYLDYEAMKANNPDLTPEIYRRNVTGFYEKISKLLRPGAYLVVREGMRPNLEKYRSYFGDRPILTWCDFAGRWHRQPYFTSIARYIGTSWGGNDKDIMSAMHTRVRPNVVNYCGNAEYTWNINAPGAALFDDHRLRIEYWTHPDEPPVIFNEFVPRACRNIWGPEAGPLMAPLFQSHLSAALLARTNAVLYYVNTRLRLDPQRYIQLDSKLLAEQVAAVDKALPGLERVYREKPPMGPHAERAFIYYYRRVRLLDVIARLRYAITYGNELADADKEDEAKAQAAAGRALYEREMPRLRQMAKETARRPNFQRRFKQRKRDVYSLLTRHDVDFDGYRKGIAALERRLADKGRKLTPLSHTGDIRVGVYDGSADGGSAIGHKGIVMTFEGKPGIKAEFITDLSLENLLKYDCVFYPQGSLGRSSTRYDFYTGLRRYVEEAGGAVWFMHNSVGTPRSEFGTTTTFPEVARGATVRKDSNRVRIVRNPITRGFEKDAVLEHGYYDHWIVRRNSKAGRSVLMAEGGPVWVAGQVGKGRVLYDGSILLTPGGNQPAAAKGDHEKLMLAALKWLTQREP